MEEEEKSRGTHALWIHKGLCVLSFQKIKGFLEIRFPTHEEMIRYAVRLTEAGYRIR